MRAFDQLSHAGQIRRLRALAIKALEAWPLRVSRVRPLTFWENATWRVDSAQGSYLLRVHREGYRSLACIEDELAWLEALHEAGLPVQRALASRDGARVVEALGPGGERRHVSLLSWIEGRRRKQLGPAEARAIGELLARLHRISETLPAQGRLAWDTQGWFAALPTGEPDVDRAIRPSDRALLERAREEILERTEALGRSPRVFGPIHSDLHLSNLIWQGSRPCPIDFDDGGPGWYGMDLGVPSVRLEQLDPGLVDHLVEGYRSQRPLSDAEVELGLAMPALRAAMVPLWYAQRQGSAKVRAAQAEGLERWLGKLRRYYGQAT